MNAQIKVYQAFLINKVAEASIIQKTSVAFLTKYPPFAKSIKKSYHP
jgi:hypothetical protein